MNYFRLTYWCVKVAVLGMMATSCTKKKTTVRSAIASDFHAPDVPGGKERVETFIKSVQDENVDFIIELGDFCRLDSASQVYRDVWNSFEGDMHHAISNHDLDRYSVDEYVKGMNMPHRYYSFDKKGSHFVILDGNNYSDGKEIYHYDHANYGKYPLVPVIEDVFVKFED